MVTFKHPRGGNIGGVADDAAAVAARKGAQLPASRRAPHVPEAPHVTAPQPVGTSATPLAEGRTTFDVPPQAPAQSASTSTIKQMAHMAGEMPDMAVLAGTMAAGAAGWVGNRVNKLAGPNIVGNALKAPQNMLNVTVADVADKLGVRDSLSSNAKSLATRVGGALDSAIPQSAKDFMAKRSAARAASSLAKAQKMVSKLDVAALPSAARGFVQDVQRSSHISHVPSASFDAVRSEMQVPGVKLPKRFAKLFTHAEKALGHHESQLATHSYKASLAAVPSAVGKASIGTVATNSAFLAAVGVQTAHTVSDFSTNLKQLSQMCEDLTGKKYSTMRLLLGDVPPAVSEARGVLLKNASLDFTGHGIATVLTIKQMFKHINPLAFMLPAFGATGAKMLMGGTDNYLDKYTALKAMHKAGQPISAEIYAEFLVSACPTCRDRAGGTGNEVIAELAKQYQSEKASPAQILGEVGAKMDARIKGIVAHAKQAFLHPEAEAPAHSFATKVGQRPQVAVAPRATGANFVDRLSSNEQAAGHTLPMGG